MEDLDQDPMTQEETLEYHLAKLQDRFDELADNISNLFCNIGIALFIFFMLAHFFDDREALPFGLSSDTNLYGVAFACMFSGLIIGKIFSFVIKAVSRRLIWEDS